MDSLNNEYLSIAETCQLLRTSRQTVYRLRKAGHLAFYNFGRAVRIRRGDAVGLMRVYSNFRRR